MKLKTLKDFELEAIDYLLLKQEAIKWVKKSLEIKRPMMTKDFMEFHNITESDLKELKGGKEK